MKRHRPWLALVLLGALGGLDSALAIESIEGSWTGWIAAGPHRLALAGWSNATRDALVLQLPQAGLFDLTFRKTQVDGQDDIMLRHDSPDAPILLRGNRESERITGSWSSGPMRGTFEMTRTGAATPAYTRREITFDSDDTRLAATVVMPRGDGPFPAIVWTHGSGATGRGSSTYVREAYMLAGHGIASILYDKRGVGASEGDWRRASFEQLARDANAAARALRKITEIDPGRVGIGGLSQGPSWIVPLAMNDGGRYAFAVLLSASAVTPALQHVNVVTTRVRQAGFSAAAVSRAREVATAEAEFHSTGLGAEALNVTLENARTEEWFASSGLPPGPIQRLPQHMLAWWDIDPIPLWKQADSIPVLALLAERDALVDVRRSARLLTEALGDRLTVRTFPAADHELLIQTGGIPILPPGRDEALRAWLDDVLQNSRQAATEELSAPSR